MVYSVTDYLEYRQKIENIFLLREPSLCYPFTPFFSEQKRKGNSLEKLFFFIEKTNKGEMGNLEENAVSS